MRGKKACVRPSAFATDIERTITGNLKRFISLFVITALGATMLVGLKAACDDLRFTADDYYDAQRLFDISVKSTLGLDEADISALGEVDGVEVAEGGYTESAYTQVDGLSEKVDLKALSAAGLNEPRVIEGRLPRDVHEAAVTQKYLDASGKKIGDTVTFESAEEKRGGTAEEGSDAAGSSDTPAIFERGRYTITASVFDPMDVNAGSKTMSFRSTGGPQYAFFLTPAAVVDRDTFTVAYLRVAGASELMSYSNEYKELIDGVKGRVEQIRERREAERTSGVKDDALAQIDERRSEADEALDAAAGELASAQTKIDAARAQIASGKLELDAKRTDASRQLDAAQSKLDAGLALIAREQGKLDSARSELTDALAGIAKAEAAVDVIQPLLGDRWPAELWARLQKGDAAAVDPFVSSVVPLVREARGELDQARTLVAEIKELVSSLPTASPEDKAQIARMLERLDALTGGRYAAAIDAVRAIVSLYPEDAGQIQQAVSKLSSIEKMLGSTASSLDAMLVDDGAQIRALAEGVARKSEVQAGLEQVAAGQRRLDAERSRAERGLGQLDAAREQMKSQIAEAEAQLIAGEGEAASGQSELNAGKAELEVNRADVNARFARARADVDGIERAKWYIQDRGALPSYASIESDASSIESIATVFPLIFFTVAVLISLTTVTRMVEEDRGLIGVYKALGYRRGRILSKYLIYSFAACLAGGIAGDALGFIALPAVIFTIFKTMYALPPFQLHFNMFTAVLGIALFALGIVGATFLACRHVLKETPASLMRPKAPRAGKRILLERITPVWRRLSFLNKVSARNLFRYKKRFFMTVFGIAGCTALMICGLGIRDTVISLKPRQYGPAGVVRYDLLAVTTDEDFAQGERELRETGMVDTMLEARVDSVTAEFGGARESVQLVVVPDNADLSAYMKTEDGSNTTFLAPAMGGEELSLPSDGNGVLVTKNAEQVLGFSLGDELLLQDSTLSQGSVRVDGIAVSFLGNFVFMTESAYAEAFGEPCVPNALLANLTGTDEQKIELADRLAAGATFVNVNSSTKVANDFSESFKIIDVVVYIVTVMAAALAFAVVFTLSNTNISERERELATIKVLGFRRGEVHRYINKETIVLTLIGIVAGWPLGYVITRFLTYVLRMPSLFFDTIVEPQTYLFASVMSFVFTLIINRMTNRSLDRIDMVGALKSAE